MYLVSKINLPYISDAVGYVQKESVEMIPVYQVGGSDKTLTKINDTMPHTWIVWDMRKELHSHITIQEIGVARSPLVNNETVRFPTKDSENTFNMSAL